MADITITLVVMDREFGIWCPACALPSGFRLVYAIGAQLFSLTRCVDCCEPIP